MNGISLDTNTYDAVVNVKHDALGNITEGLSFGFLTYRKLQNSKTLWLLLCRVLLTLYFSFFIFVEIFRV